MIPKKTEKDLQMLRQSGRVLAGIMQQLVRAVKAGVTTAEIDCLAEELFARSGVKSAFKGYRGFPASICVSVNEEIVHGIPGERQLQEGDILSIDLGVNHAGFFTDAATTVAVGKIDAGKKNLLQAAKQALELGIKQAKAGNCLSDISYAIQQHAEKHGFSVVRQFVGHGIGRALHEEPEIPNFGLPRQGPRLEAGMVLAIEPMLNLGTWEAQVAENGWTAVTKDKLPSAHFEHTVAITPEGAEILTII